MIDIYSWRVLITAIIMKKNNFYYLNLEEPFIKKCQKCQKKDTDEELEDLDYEGWTRNIVFR